MKKKNLFLLLAALLLVSAVVGIFAYGFSRYQNKGLALVSEMEGSYDYNGKILFGKDKKEAYRYESLGRAGFVSLKEEKFSLSAFFEDKEGEYRYFVYPYKNDYDVIYPYYYPAMDGYEPFWPACRLGKVLYVDEEGKKYRIHPAEGLCYPMFSDSIEGVDPYGTDVLGFSANASYAIALKDGIATVYHTDPMDDSLRVVEVKEYDLTAFGETITFGAFVSETDAYFMAEKNGETAYFAFNAKTGETASSLLEKGEYSQSVSRLYAQRNHRSEKEEKKGFFLSWSHLLLGKVWNSPVLEGYREGEILSVSPDGTYALARVKGEVGEEIIVCNEKRVFSVSSVLGDGEEITSLDFAYENVIALGIKTGEKEAYRCYKICF